MDEESERQRYVDEHRNKKQAVMGSAVFVAILFFVAVLRWFFG